MHRGTGASGKDLQTGPLSPDYQITYIPVRDADQLAGIRREGTVEADDDDEEEDDEEDDEDEDEEDEEGAVTDEDEEDEPDGVVDARLLSAASFKRGTLERIKASNSASSVKASETRTGAAVLGTGIIVDGVGALLACFDLLA